MPKIAITAEKLGKVFCRSPQDTFFYSLQDQMRKLLRRAPLKRLRPNEFWALRELSFSVAAGTCLGIIGPNGSGKSTLLKLINQELRPTVGTVFTSGQVKALIRIGTGLQPLLSGRENIYIQCTQLGLSKRQTDGLMDDIVAFAGLEACVDALVKTYSTGMYARLEFAIATSARTDVLLVDEVLAVGDIAFQLRALERINQLKRAGTAIIFVSHSEMNVRQVADRCLLLFDGRQLALGDPDALFYKYYEAVGYLNRQLKPLGTTPPMPENAAGDVRIRAVEQTVPEHAEMPVRTGSAVAFVVVFDARRAIEDAVLSVQFWNSAGILIAAIDSRSLRTTLRLLPGTGRIHVQLPFLPLTAGIYRIGVEFTEHGRPLAYGGNLLRIVVADAASQAPGSLIVLDARLRLTD